MSPARREEALRHADERGFRHTLVDEAPVIILHLDVHGCIEFVNPYFEELSGYRLEDIIGQDWFALMLPARTMQRAREVFDAGIVMPGAITATGVIVTSDGTARDIEWFSRVVVDGSGVITGMLAIGTDVTERLAREAVLRRGELRLDMAQRIVRLGTWERDRQRRTSWYSDHVFELLGVERGEDPPSGIIYAHTHPVDQAVLEALYAESRSDPREFELTHRIVTGSGEERWVVQRWFTEFDHDGNPVSSLGTLQDITERHRIEEDLRQFRQTLDETLDSVFMFDAESLRFIYVNQGAIEQVGYSRDELLRMHPYDIKVEYDESAFREVIAPMLAGETDRIGFEATHMHRDGHQTPVEISLQLVTSEGHPSRFVAVVHDLTERRRTEQLLRDVNAELEQRVAERTAELVESEADLRRAQQIARLGQFTSGRHGEDMVASDEFYRVLGLDPETDRLDRTVFFERVHPDDHALVRPAVARAAETGEPVRIDLRIIRPDGSMRWAQEEIVAEPASEDRSIRLRGTLQDITERKQVEAALIEARYEAERANLAKTEFLSHMSHELRTPLNAVLGFAQVVDDGTLSDEHAEFVREIQRAGEHLLDMVNELLDLTRIEAGAIHVESRAVESDVIVAACVASVRPLASQRDVTIDVAAGDGVVVVADPIRLRQVLLNLLSNAIKYNKVGGSVRVDCAEVGDRSRITVSDTGVGIAEEAFEELFTPFARLEATYSGIEGAGIGLALSKRLVEAMGGEIGAQSTVGEGSEFWVELPTAVTRTPGVRPAAPVNGDAPRVDDRVRVLCVEDNPSNLRLLERIIGARNEFEMLQAQRGDAALRLAANHRPDVILLDLGLPGLDGYEVLRRLRADPSTAEIPVIAVTASAIPSEIERAGEAGFAGFVSKPFTAAGLLDAIRRCLPTDDVPVADAGGPV